MPRHVVQVSGDTLIDDSFSGYNILATGGIANLTLAANPPDDADIIITNGDQSNSKRLHGFPSWVKTKLYPNRSISLNSKNGNWFVTASPSRFEIGGTFCVYVDPTAPSGGDGLTPYSALNTSAAAVLMVQSDLDTQQSMPIIALKAGCTHDAVLLGGQPLGGNLIALSVYGVGEAKIQSLDTPAISVADNAEIDIDTNLIVNGNSLRLCGNQNNHVEMACGVGSHNNGLFDQSGKVTVVGNGGQSSAYFFDGPCPGASIANGFYLENTFGDVFRMDEGGGRFTLSGFIGPSAPTMIGRMLSILGGNELILGGPQMAPASAYLQVANPSLVGGLLITNGVNIPGGTQIVGNGRVLVTKVG